ncbi:MAG TPA: monofunctional biosynthetic peptidoglycan transglycosylase [Arenimonas sp.]|uniref:monofunctional biosynthetic peptidoglycan transglycosylase n=1 Tax=Arenimonas sp. TaxID=1872635 RepID=UPI002CA0463D|nr:monofunctional biosynthetic peptidoglycan transglycosylase [Arenimonas sp.]HMB56114.1 monofunctional biosynthetic peptidoglycan transglycosylase [Arenimonas sp.]
MSAAIISAPVRGAASPRRKRRWLRLIFFWLPLWFVLITMAQVLVLRWVPPFTSAFMIDRQFEAISAGDWQFRPRYEWQEWNKLSPNLPISLVAAEDQKFPSHNGFDFQAIDKAMAHNKHSKRVRGASTISQQVAKNLFLWPGRSYLRKGLEAWYTVLIELFWSKQRILEVYANIAEFGDGIYGAEAAGKTFFGHSAIRLSPSESARLAAVLPNPKKYNARKPGAYVLRRANWIQRQVGHLGGASYLASGRALENVDDDEDDSAE